jgi:predicted phage terminase large subunit-like protein
VIVAFARAVAEFAELGETGNVLENERELGVRSLYEFTKLAWPHVDTSPYSDNWHIPLLCEELEMVTRGETVELVVNIPPGCMKSRLVCVFWPIWSWLQDAKSRFIGASMDIGLTTRDARDSIALINSPWFQERWGHLVSVEKEASTLRHVNRKGGWRVATSIGGKIIGNHADFAIIDDPSKPLDVQLHPKKTLEKAKRWRYGTLPTRFRNAKRRCVVLIMQRLHEDDLAGQALRKGVRALILPMRFDPARAHPKDPRKVAGELLWLERFPEEALRPIEDDLGPRQTASQMQQQPAPDDGIVFKRGWFKYYREAPAVFDMMFQSWDCTFKDLDSSDFVVGQVWGVRGGEFYLLDQTRERMTFTETLHAIEALTRKWPKAIAKLIEDKANGTAVIDTLKRKVSGIIAVNPEGGKAARASAISPLYEAGNVYHPHPDVAPWIGAFEEELVGFPTTKNDDQVDGTSQALHYARMKVRSYAAAAKKAPYLFGLA